ncbi:DUF2188 domain-containing protein [Lysinibacillus sp. FSL K6-4013]|uniref:DUF2188 domain-containing protein n=1 Tax=Lysinibacillus sp. FSL K6-4013 TaxID=2921504 RepID=UPI00315B15E9
MNMLHSIVANIMSDNLDVSKSSSILVLTDHSTSLLAKKFKDALIANGWNTSFYEMEDRTKSGEEPTKEASDKILEYDLVFCLTKHSLTHTLARKNANIHGVSVITMPGITEDMFLHGAMKADYHRVEKETMEMTDKLSKAERVTIKTGSGYRLSIPLSGRTRATVNVPTQKEAIKIATGIAKNQKSEVVIHNREGKIREKNSYGNDPFPPKG